MTSKFLLILIFSSKITKHVLLICSVDFISKSNAMNIKKEDMHLYNFIHKILMLGIVKEPETCPYGTTIDHYEFQLLHSFKVKFSFVLFSLEDVLDYSPDYTCTIFHCLKASYSKEHSNSTAPCHTRASLPAGITLHVSTPVPNHTPHNPETVMPRARLYKGELASPSRYTTLFTTLLRLFSQFHY